jgi:hypothetical protein
MYSTWQHRVPQGAFARLERHAGRSSRQGCHRAGGSPAVSNAPADTERYHILRWVTPRAMRGVNGLAAQSVDGGGNDLEVERVWEPEHQRMTAPP